MIKEISVLILAYLLGSIPSGLWIGKVFFTHEELLANNQIYREVYESQTQGGGDFDEKGGA